MGGYGALAGRIPVIFSLGDCIIYKYTQPVGSSSSSSNRINIYLTLTVYTYITRVHGRKEGCWGRPSPETRRLLSSPPTCPTQYTGLARFWRTQASTPRLILVVSVRSEWTCGPDGEHVGGEKESKKDYTWVDRITWADRNWALDSAWCVLVLRLKRFTRTMLMKSVESVTHC